MANKYFYNNLPYVNKFKDLTNLKLYKDVPLDWYVLVVDVEGSTIAVETGKYKEVNFVASCAISAILNIESDIQLPFVFGGDGATILIPPEMLEKAQDALRDAKNLAKKEFKINLRTGFVPVIDLYRKRTKVRIIKLKVSENYFQSVFTGGGIDLAETLVKENKKYQIYYEPPKFRPDYKGVKCVWQDIPGRKDEVVSLLIKATSIYKNHSLIYQDVMDKIQEIYGNKSSRYPVRNGKIRIKNTIKKVYFESILESYQYKTSKNKLFIKKLIIGFLENYKIIFKQTVDNISTHVFKKTVIQSIDSEKFDDMLRMVITGTKDQRRKLKRYLEASYKAGELAYGIKATKSVYVTCLIYQRQGSNVHFIDGSNGGYTFAAKEFKNRMKWLKVYMQAI